jgi:hypothetical protein
MVVEPFELDNGHSTCTSASAAENFTPYVDPDLMTGCVILNAVMIGPHIGAFTHSEGNANDLSTFDPGLRRPLSSTNEITSCPVVGPILRIGYNKPTKAASNGAVNLTATEVAGVTA